MKITVYGSSGQVGQQVVALGLERGYTVVAFVHSHNPFSVRPGLRVVTGDIHVPTDVASAMKGSQAIISTLGSWHTDQQDVLSSAMQSIIPAMVTQDIRRIITLTGTAALWSGDKPKWYNKLDRLMLRLVGPKVLRDAEAHLGLLSASSLDWSSIRSPVMTKGSNTTYQLSKRLPLGLTTITRAAVATALVDQLGQAEYVRQAPVIYKH